MLHYWAIYFFPVCVVIYGLLCVCVCFRKPQANFSLVNSSFVIRDMKTDLFCAMDTLAWSVSSYATDTFYWKHVRGWEDDWWVRCLVMILWLKCVVTLDTIVLTTALKQWECNEIHPAKFLMKDGEQMDCHRQKHNHTLKCLILERRLFPKGLIK